MIRRPPRSTRFPYPALFRSRPEGAGARRRRRPRPGPGSVPDRKSTRLNSSHVAISYAVFCLKKKKLVDRATLSKMWLLRRILMPMGVTDAMEFLLDKLKHSFFF